MLDNLTYGYHGILPHISNPSFEFISGDIRNINDIKSSLKDVDVIIHLAAIVGYPSCKSQPTLASEVNYYATKKIVKYAKAPIIFASTGSCYGAVQGVCTEETPLKPITEYGKTKMKAEQEIKKHSAYIIFRFSTGFGLSLRPRLDLLVNDFVMKAVKNKELIVFEKTYQRAFIHVKDMVRGFLFALDRFDDMNNEIYNVGSETLNLTKEQVALCVKKYVNFHLKFAEFGHDPDRRNYQVSFQKIRKLGFKTRYVLDDGIKEILKVAPFIDQRESYYNDRVFK